MHNKIISEIKDLYEKYYKESFIKSYDEIDDSTLLDYINSIPQDEIKNQYINYRFTKISNLFKYNIVSPILKENESGEYINKNRTITVDAKTVQHDICQLFGLSPWQFVLLNCANNITCLMYIPDIDINVKLLEQTMLQLGWGLGRCMKVDPFNKHYAILKFEPLYGIDVTNEIHKLKYIYHISPAINYKSIKQNGFIPQNKNNIFNYPDRIYFLKDAEYINKSYFIEVIMELYNTNNMTKYLVYKLDVNKIPYKIKFQDDPNTEDGCFTYDNLSYKSVIDIIKIDLSNEL